MAGNLMPARRAAWSYGRRIADEYLAQYREEYGVEPPAFALVIDEVIRDFLRARLHVDALPLGVFAQTRWREHHFEITVNSRTAEIEGVKDAAGVMNVAKCHEVIHIEKHGDVLRTPQSQMFPGFGDTRTIVCYRSGPSAQRGEALQREFFAEEAGRAAAISPRALRSAPAFRHLLEQAGVSTGPLPDAWPCLYDTAKQIGVNISALVKQLTEEGLVVLESSGGRQVVHVQPSMFDAALAAAVRDEGGTRAAG